MKTIITTSLAAALAMSVALPAHAQFTDRTIRIANGIAEDHPVADGVDAFTQCVDETSGGAWTVNAFWSSALGDDLQSAQSLRSGTLEMVISSTSPLVAIEPALGVFDLPFLISSEEEADALLDGVGLVVVTGDEPAIEGAAEGAFPEVIRSAARGAGIPVARADASPGAGATDVADRGPAEELKGAVALVGGGPGEDGLLTIRGRELLMHADVIVADRLAPQRVLAEVPAGTEIIDAAKIPYGRQMAQQAINEALIENAKAGKFVVRFKGGDNFLFGRGYEEALALAEHGIPTFVVPGVTSAFAGPALGGVTVTHRGVTHEVTVISGHVPPGHDKSLVNWSAVAAMRGTVVLLMAVKNGPAIADALLEGGRPAGTPVSIIESASLSTERRIDATLESLREVMARENVVPPAIIVIGDVAGLPQVLAPDRF